jgi:hypothetical protein
MTSMPSGNRVIIETIWQTILAIQTISRRSNQRVSSALGLQRNETLLILQTMQTIEIRHFLISILRMWRWSMNVDIQIGSIVYGRSGKPLRVASVEKDLWMISTSLALCTD